MNRKVINMSIMVLDYSYLKFMFSKKATKIDEIFTVDLTLCSKCQIDGEDFANFCGLPRKHELYKNHMHNFNLNFDTLSRKSLVGYGGAHRMS